MRKPIRVLLFSSFLLKAKLLFGIVRIVFFPLRRLGKAFTWKSTCFERRQVGVGARPHVWINFQMPMANRFRSFDQPARHCAATAYEPVVKNVALLSPCLRARHELLLLFSPALHYCKRRALVQRTNCLNRRQCLSDAMVNVLVIVPT